MNVARRPLEWYVEELARRPLVCLTWGDGEFQAASRTRTGERFQCNELVTTRLEDQLRAALAWEDGRAVWGTDPFLIEYTSYPGRDWDVVLGNGRLVRQVLEECKAEKQWADATVWDTAVREGRLGSFLRWLRTRKVVVVGNPRLANWEGWAARRTEFVAVPAEDAAAKLDQTYATARSAGLAADAFVLCCGLGAIPLAVRLADRFPRASVLDLGSTFDVFVRLGATRGWRAELYEDPEAWRRCCEANLEGVR